MFIFIQSVSIEAITFLYLVSNLIPFIINLINGLLKLYKIKSTKINRGIIRDNLHKLITYGVPVSINSSIYYFWDQIQLQVIGKKLKTQMK